MRQYQLLMANSKKQSKACTKKAKMTILVLSHFTGYISGQRYLLKWKIPVP